MLHNFHTHTSRCHHAYGEDEEYVAAAVAAGLVTLGFSDHAPLVLPEGIEGGKLLTTRMTPEETEGYFSSLLALREKYRGALDIRIGMEMEYDPITFGRNLDFLSRFPLDYLILGQHFLHGDLTGESTPMTPREKLGAYVRTVCEGMRTGVFTYVAHPDFGLFYIAREEPETPLEECVGALSPIIETARETHVPLEYNLLGQSEGRPYPCPAFWREVARRDVPVVIGCDAHTPTRVANADEVRVAEKTLADLGIRPLAAPVLTDPFRRR